MIDQFYGTLNGITNPSQGWPENIGDEGVLHIPQSSRTGWSYPYTYLGWEGPQLSAEVLLVYSTVSANRVDSKLYIYIYIYIYYIMRVLVISKSLCGYLSNQVKYNMESAQYLW